MARSEIGPLNVVIGTDIRGLEQGMDRVKQKTRQTASEIGSMGSMLGASKIGRSIREAGEKLGITMSAESRAMMAKGAALAGAFIIGFKGAKIGDQLMKEFGGHGLDPRKWVGRWEGAREGTRMENVGGRWEEQQGWAGSKADYVSHGLRAFGQNWLANKFDDLSDLQGRQATSERLREERARRGEIGRRGHQYEVAQGLAGADILDQSAVADRRGIDKRLADIENTRRSEQRKLTSEFQSVAGRTGTEARAYGRQQQMIDLKAETERRVVLRDYNRDLAESIRSSQDEVSVIRAKLQYGERAAQLKEIELRYARQIRDAEWEGQGALADQLRLQRDASVAEERRMQDLDRRRERGDLLTEIGTNALDLIGRGADAQRLNLNHDIESRKEQARATLKGSELQERLGQLDTLRRVGMAGIDASGSIGYGSGNELIGPKTRVKGMDYSALAASSNELSQAVRVEGWERQVQLLERMAAALERGVPAMAT